MNITLMNRLRVVCVLLSLGAIVGLVSVIQAGGLPWSQAEAVVQLGKFPRSPGDEPHPAHALAVNTERLPAVLWPAPETEDGQTLVLGWEVSAGTWKTSTLMSSTQRIWSPALAYHGSDLIAMWLEGDQEGWQGKLFQMDVAFEAGGLVTSEISEISDAFGYAIPDIAVGPTGFHGVHTMAFSINSIDQGELYYAHRQIDDQDLNWTSKLIVGRTDVITGAESIRRPRIALSTDGKQAHVVWQQNLVDLGDGPRNQVWYMLGEWNDDDKSMVWGDPVRITAGEHERMVEPKIAVDPSDDSVYITWVHWIVEPNKEQHVYLCRWDGVGCEILTQLNERIIEVTEGAPFWAHPSVVARDEMVCVSWHAQDQVHQQEEVIARCSRDRGETWQNPINISMVADDDDEIYYAVYADIHLDTLKQLHVVWLQLSLDRFLPIPDHIYYRRGTSTLNIVYLPLITRGYR